jgi:hypothetical protein
MSKIWARVGRWDLNPASSGDISRVSPLFSIQVLEAGHRLKIFKQVPSIKVIQKQNGQDRPEFNHAFSS